MGILAIDVVDLFYRGLMEQEHHNRQLRKFTWFDV